MAKDIREHGIVQNGRRDFADTISHECLCGSGLFYIIASFYENELSGYYTQAVCWACGAWLTVPCPEDTSVK